MSAENDPTTSLASAMEEYRSSGQHYGEALFVASLLSPGVGSTAWTAHRHRVTMINLPQMGRWFRAVDDLLAALGLYYIGFQRSVELKAIAFLVERTIRDFQAVAELSLGGLRAAAFDSVRDTMEIEYLLNDFFHEPTHIHEWLNAETREHRDKFQPIKLRRREASRQGVKVEELQANTDYKTHSESLHVNVHYPLTTMKGVHEFDQSLSLFPMYELFFHGAGVLRVLMNYDVHLDEETLAAMGNLSLDRFFMVWGEMKGELDRIRETMET